MFKIATALILFSFLSGAAGAVESETVKGAQKDYQAFKIEMSERLTRLDEQLTQLRSEIKQKGDSTKNETIKSLEKSRRDLQTQYDSQLGEGSRHWKNFKDSFADSVNRLNEKVQKALKDEQK